MPKCEDVTLATALLQLLDGAFSYLKLGYKIRMEGYIYICSYDDASSPGVSASAVCLADITLSNVWSGTVMPLVSMSATIAMAASSSPRSRHNDIISS